MNPNLSELLRQGLIMTAIGMGLVFAALALLWGVMALFGRLSTETPEPAVLPASPAIATAHASEADTLTAERAQVATIVAGALLANAISLPVHAPAGPTFEHGRSAPSWVSTNRARVLGSWQPPRFDERIMPTYD